MTSNNNDNNSLFEDRCLLESDIDKNPLKQLEKWLQEAKQDPSISEIHSYAMSLSTVDSKGRPSSRNVLLRKVEDEGLTFFTNYTSRKSKAMFENPNVALLFFWPSINRQIRIEGVVKQASQEKSNEYWKTRPRDSQIGAWSSNQSQEIESANKFFEKIEETKKKFENENEIPRPEFWGGWTVHPNYFEFWQERKFRLHDRIVFEPKKSELKSKISETDWKIKRIQP